MAALDWVQSLELRKLTSAADPLRPYDSASSTPKSSRSTGQAHWPLRAQVLLEQEVARAGRRGSQPYS